jgi:hypothetical protein
MLFGVIARSVTTWQSLTWNQNDLGKIKVIMTAKMEIATSFHGVKKAEGLAMTESNIVIPAKAGIHLWSN